MSVSATEPKTHVDFLQGGNKQVCDLCHLSESEAGDRAGALMECQSFTVTVPSDVTFGQHHTAVCEACTTKDKRKHLINLLLTAGTCTHYFL